jgi:GH43 family beta-xylosidase
MRIRLLRASLVSVASMCVLALATFTSGPAAAAASPGVPNPLNGGADPSLVFHSGVYYLATTLGDHIGVWRARSLSELPAAGENVVWRDGDPSRNQQVWAPAMYRFVRPEGPRWYIYYTASNGVDANHRMYVIESDGDNPLGPYHFKARLADFGEYAIDGEPFVHNGRMFFAWSGPGRGMGGPAQIYLMAMSDPWTTVGARVALPASGGCSEVREGVTFLYRNGRTFLVYSTCDTGKPDYQLWMKSLPNGADPMVPGNWTQHPGPVFSRNDAAGVFGPGHNSFFRSPDGTEDWIAYHGKTSSAYTYAGRTTRAQRISWNADGTPNLGRPLALGTFQLLPSGDPMRSPQASRAFVAGDQRHYFDRAPDGSLAHWLADPDSTVRSETWPGGPITGRPTGYSVGAEEHVFARGGGGGLTHSWWEPGMPVRTEDWGGDIAGDPTGMVTPNGQRHVFARASTGSLSHWWWDPGDARVHRDTWGGDLIGNPVAYAWAEEQHVFGRGPDNTLRHWYWYDGIRDNLPALDDWGAVGRVFSDPAGFAYGDQQHVFYRGPDGGLEHRFFDHGDWTHTTDSWGGQVAGAPAAIVHGDEQHVFARSSANTPAHWWWAPGATARTDDWGGILTGTPAALSWQGDLYAFGRTADGTLLTWRSSPAAGVSRSSWGGQIADPAGP